MEEPKIGIIGMGVVGNAMYGGMKLFWKDIVGYDIDPNKGMQDNFNKIIKTDIVFLCLPTIPEKETNKMVLTPLLDTIKKLSDENYKGIIVIKSSLLPLTTEHLAMENPNLKIVHSPEFLREKTATEDIINERDIVIGLPDGVYDDKQLDYLIDFFKEFYKRKVYTEVFITNSTSSEFAKLMKNAFFATKVVFANEMNELADAYTACYGDVLDILYLDNRIGRDHLAINEEKAYGGMCLPKDVKMFLADHKYHLKKESPLLTLVDKQNWKKIKLSDTIDSSDKI